MRRIKFKGSENQQSWKPGYFHQWITTGTDNEIVAIIEDSDGYIHMVYPDLINFISEK